MKAFTCIPLALLAFISFASTGQLSAAVEITSTSGDVLVGEIAEETDKTLTIKRIIMVGHKPVETTTMIKKNNIALRKEVPSLLEQYKERAGRTPDALLPVCSLARWCFERALVEQALTHTKQADKIERDNPIVAKLYQDLGYVQDDGKWISEEEYLAKTGKVNLGGEYLTKEEAEAAKAKIRSNVAVAQLEQKIRDAEWAIKINEKKIAEATAERDQAKAEAAKAKAETAGAKNRIEQAQNRQQRRTGRVGTVRSQEQERLDQLALTEARQVYARSAAAEKRAEKEQAHAEENLAKYKAALEKAKAELPELKKALEEATGDSINAAEENTPSPEKPAAPLKEDAPEKERPSGGRFGRFDQ